MRSTPRLENMDALSTRRLTDEHGTPRREWWVRVGCGAVRATPTPSIERSLARSEPVPLPRMVARLLGGGRR